METLVHTKMSHVKTIDFFKQDLQDVLEQHGNEGHQSRQLCVKLRDEKERLGQHGGITILKQIFRSKFIGYVYVMTRQWQMNAIGERLASVSETLLSKEMALQRSLASKDALMREIDDTEQEVDASADHNNQLLMKLTAGGLRYLSNALFHMARGQLSFRYRLWSENLKAEEREDQISEIQHRLKQEQKVLKQEHNAQMTEAYAEAIESNRNLSRLEWVSKNQGIKNFKLFRKQYHGNRLYLHNWRQNNNKP